MLTNSKTVVHQTGHRTVETPSAAASTASQIKQQRRRYASVVLTALAKTNRGRPTTQVQQALKTSLTPLGVRLSATALHQLAANITAGRPVQLP